jgi:nucleotidyltransferase/DNA polymerase involved in DNA repair
LPVLIQPASREMFSVFRDTAPVVETLSIDVAFLVGLLRSGRGHHLHALSHARDPRRVRTRRHSS